MSERPVIRLTLPWAVLASSNDRAGIAGAVNRARWRRYSRARDAARALVASQTRYERLLVEPVAVEVVFWLPDLRRRDPANVLKLLHDSMSGIVYEDDSQIRRHAWEVAGIDRESPRALVTVTALADGDTLTHGGEHG